MSFHPHGCGHALAGIVRDTGRGGTPLPCAPACRMTHRARRIDVSDKSSYRWCLGHSGFLPSCACRRVAYEDTASAREIAAFGSVAAANRPAHQSTPVDHQGVRIKTKTKTRVEGPERKAYRCSAFEVGGAAIEVLHPIRSPARAAMNGTQDGRHCRFASTRRLCPTHLNRPVDAACGGGSSNRHLGR